MNSTVMFKGDWIRESVAHKKQGGSSWWDLFGIGEFATDEMGAFFFILLAIGAIAGLVALCIKLFRKPEFSDAAVNYHTLMTAEAIHFTVDGESVESYAVHELREIRIVQESDSRNLLERSDVLPATNVIELLLQDNRRCRHAFGVRSFFMNAQLHRIIQAWRQRLPAVIHVHDGNVQAAWI